MKKLKIMGMMMMVTNTEIETTRADLAFFIHFGSGNIFIRRPARRDEFRQKKRETKKLQSIKLFFNLEIPIPFYDFYSEIVHVILSCIHFNYFDQKLNKMASVSYQIANLLEKVSFTGACLVQIQNIVVEK